MEWMFFWGAFRKKSSKLGGCSFGLESFNIQRNPLKLRGFALKFGGESFDLECFKFQRTIVRNLWRKVIVIEILWNEKFNQTHRFLCESAMFRRFINNL